MGKTTERVHFRLIHMECCGTLFCCVNPRLPSYCIECGRRVYPEVRGWVLASDDNAIIKYSEAMAQQIECDDPVMKPEAVSAIETAEVAGGPSALNSRAMYEVFTGARKHESGGSEQ